ncbi:MAG TPA: WYL domain-containing protein [Actinomycetota bacterium]|nr:WYL domain-containing protein [Actinomycetota bacterium]
MHPLERLVNLVALLLESKTPLTFEQIREKLAEGYEHRDQASAKRMFERDKDVLRDVGVPIEVVATDAWEVEQGYTIDKERYYLPEIAFTPEEISALLVAARSGGDVSAEDAVRKLLSGAEGGILAGLGGSGLGGETEASLPPAAEAVAGQRRVRFRYRTSRGESSDRTVDAFGLAIRGGHWYLVGHDHGRGEIRSFRLSRIVGELEVEGEGSPPPPGFRAADHVQAGPWGPGEARTTATVAFAPDVAWWAANGVVGADVARTRPDGWVEIHVPWQPGESLAAWVLSFGPDAEAVAPPDLRAEVVARLEALGAS